MNNSELKNYEKCRRDYYSPKIKDEYCYFNLTALTKILKLS